MRIFDLNHLKSGSVFETDLCIIGTGPAGLSIANEFSGAGTRVMVLESGGIRDESETQSLYDIESTGAPRVLNQELIRTRILGGSSHVWTGRCAPFDELDFDSRSWIPYSGWPLTRADLEPYFQRAAPYLGLAPARYDETLWEQFQVDPPRPPLDAPALKPMFWQFSRRRRGSGSAHFGKDWVDGEAPNVEILLHANVLQINVGADGTRFESVDVCSLGGKQAQVRSRAGVLCCGGIENARLLLASNRVHSPGVGNQNDLVGRFLMDHTSSSLGYFEPSQAFRVRARFGHYWLDDAEGRHVYLHGLGLSRDIQEKEGLVNCHAYIEERGRGEGDPWDALERIKFSARSGTIPRRDVSLILSHLDEIAGGLYRRRFHHRPQLGRVKAVELHLMLEQAPDPESRVTLSETRKDALGMPFSSIHWRIGDLERISAKRMLELLAGQFKRLGLPVPHGVPPLTERSHWISRCTEKAHPSGTTRMASDAKQGVVDTNCEVHGVRGLFVSGSSIFPTSGAANPTLMIVAMAVRLADYLKAQCARPNRTVTVASAPMLREKYDNVRPLTGDLQSNA
jgi:choline dehydrogenase-like flavoprotein